LLSLALDLHTFPAIILDSVYEDKCAGASQQYVENKKNTAIVATELSTLTLHTCEVRVSDLGPKTSYPYRRFFVDFSHFPGKFLDSIVAYGPVAKR
jgi:hypothetical protein